MNPRARKEGLLVEELSDETLVYDRERHKAHCLNETAAFVWSRCDGQTGVKELARLLGVELGGPANEEVVWLALDRLREAHLLRKEEAEGSATPRYSRRELVKKLGRIGLAVPMVVSIASPLAAQAGSCITRAECRALVPPACNGQPVCGPPAGKCCRPKTATTCKEVNC